MPCSLQVFGVGLYVRVFQEHRQAGFPAEHVVQGFGQRFAGQQSTLFQLIPAPLEEVADDRP